MIVRLNKDFTVNMAEHEFVLSFTSDSDAEMFHDWWYCYDGLQQFLDWHKENKKDYT